MTPFLDWTKLKAVKTLDKMYLTRYYTAVMPGRKKSSTGDTLETFLQQVNLHEDVYDTAIKRVVAWQFEQARKNCAMTKGKLAATMKTSRSQVDRILDPNNYAVSLQLLNRAAMALGMHLKVELVDHV